MEKQLKGQKNLYVNPPGLYGLSDLVYTLQYLIMILTYDICETH